MGLMGTIHRPPRTEKCAYLYIFGFHDAIHNFKNYFVTVFLVISFQFSANKRYPNRPQKIYEKYKIKFGKERKKNDQSGQKLRNLVHENETESGIILVGMERAIFIQYL